MIPTKTGTQVLTWTRPFDASNIDAIYYGSATGGTGSDINADSVRYRMLTFTSTSTLTVTRAGYFDATIIGGGAGEPTLAEGMFSYIDADNSFSYYDGSAWVSAGAAAGDSDQIVLAVQVFS